MTPAGKILRNCRVFAHCDVFIGNGLLFRKKKKKKIERAESLHRRNITRNLYSSSVLRKVLPDY